MAEGGHSFGEILLGGRGGVSNGVLRVTPAGFHWKRKQGSKVVDVKKDEIESLFWMKIVRGCQLSVRRKEGASVNFLGFREKDYEVLSSYAKQTFGVEVKEQALSTTGRNWGSVAINGSSLMFLVDGKVALEVPLPDVCAAQQQRDEVMLEFHVDDSASEVPEDVLAEMAFHIPQTNEDYPATGDDVSAKVLLDSLLPHVDTEAASTDEAVCIFGEVGVLAPRGRFDIEMHLSYLAMGGQSQDFKVRYTSIQRIFILPKANNQTLVVISLDPPIRKGQTYYTHLLCQFPTDEEVTIDLDITDEALAAKNEKVGGKLSKEMSGAMFDVFARILRGLSGARITRAGIFKNAMQDGVAVRCSYKADDGFLYPLDKAFFYIHKPPLLIPYEDVAAVEFKRQEGFAGNVKTFDLSVRMHSDQEHLFRSVQRTEWQNLLDFFSAKKIRIENLAGAQKGPGAAGPSVLDDMDDMGMRHAGAEDDEDEDEDFDAGAESSDDSEGSEDDEDEEGSGDAEIIPEEGIAADMLDKKKGKKRREASDDEGGGGGDEDKPAAKKPKGTPAPGAPKAAKPVKEKKEKKEASEGAKDGDEGKDSAGKDKEKKGRRKKDPNAPKNAMSAFMYFSNKNRDAIKQEIPDIKFTEIGKVLGERWKAMNAEDKAPYEEMAKADKERYTRQMAEFKADGKFTAVGGPSGASGGGDGADGGGSDAEE